MTSDYRIPNVGIEEEYQLVDAESGDLVPRGRQVLQEARQNSLADIQHELHLEQIEMASPILKDSASIASFVARTRLELNDAAKHYNASLVAAGTHPMHMSSFGHVTPVARYQAMAERYQTLAKELMIFGFHVHLDMPDREIGVGVMNRLRPWLPLLQAITANSPFWNDADTGYASFRRELWSQWPLAGCPSVFLDYADYQECVKELVSSGAIDDPSKVYWDVRLPERLPTIEIRIADVLTKVDQVVAYVAILRSLVMRCEKDFLEEKPFLNPRPELLKSAMWHAARFGLSSTIVNFATKKPSPALAQLAELREYIYEPLAALGDFEMVQAYAASLKVDGTPAEAQRLYHRQFNGDFRRVVKQLAFDTLKEPSITKSS